MSKKSRRQNKSTAAGSAGGSSAAARGGARPEREHRGLRDLRPREDLAVAGQQEGNPAILISALIVTSLFIGAYYHLLVLQQMTYLADGLAMPDSLITGYSAEHVAALSAAMDDDARGQLNWVHKTAGVIFPIAVALTVSAVGAWRLRTAGAKWAVVGLGVIFAVVDIWENIAIESAIAAGGQGADLASALTQVRWGLLALIVALIIGLLVAGRRRRGTRREPAATR